MADLPTYREDYRRIVGDCPESEANSERLAAALLAAQRKAALMRQGWKIRQWNPMSRGPLAQKICNGIWEWEYGVGGVIDHPYRLVHKEKGRELFILEPYQLTREGMEVLAKLDSDKWSFYVSGDWTIHFPGRTMCVVIERRGKGAW